MNELFSLVRHVVLYVALCAPVIKSVQTVYHFISRVIHYLLVYLFICLPCCALLFNSGMLKDAKLGHDVWGGHSGCNFQSQQSNLCSGEQNLGSFNQRSQEILTTRKVNKLRGNIFTSEEKWRSAELDRQEVKKWEIISLCDETTF